MDQRMVHEGDAFNDGSYRLRIAELIRKQSEPLSVGGERRFEVAVHRRPSLFKKSLRAKYSVNMRNEVADSMLIVGNVEIDGCRRPVGAQLPDGRITFQSRTHNSSSVGMLKPAAIGSLQDIFLIGVWSVALCVPQRGAAAEWTEYKKAPHLRAPESCGVPSGRCGQLRTFRNHREDVPFVSASPGRIGRGHG